MKWKNKKQYQSRLHSIVITHWFSRLIDNDFVEIKLFGGLVSGARIASNLSLCLWRDIRACMYLAHVLKLPLSTTLTHWRRAVVSCARCASIEREIGGVNKENTFISPLCPIWSDIIWWIAWYPLYRIGQKKRCRRRALTRRTRHLLLYSNAKLSLNLTCAIRRRNSINFSEAWSDECARECVVFWPCHYTAATIDCECVRLRTSQRR